MRKTKTLWVHSLISLLLCASMLIGSTFAWFTDSVTSTKNIITAGNLDLEMYWTYDLASGIWYNAEDDANNTIFNYDNWEPGYTDVRYIKLVNAGNLALNYQLSLTPQGTVGKLAEVIDVYYSTDGAAVSGRDAVTSLTYSGLLNDLAEGGVAAKGALLPKSETDSGEVIVTLAMSMQTTAGNEYQKETIGDGFTVTALATQQTFEEDSFGDDYDEDATFPGIINPDKGTAAVTPDANGKLTESVTVSGTSVSATLPQGVQLADGATQVELTVTPMENTTSDVAVSDGEVILPVDVHMEGVAEENDTAIIISLGKILPVGLNMGNIKLYHVEDGVTNEMARVSALADLDAHNEYYYDPATGEVTVAMKSFSEITFVSEDAQWEGDYDYTWYDEPNVLDGMNADYVIANADQLAGLSAIVGGMDGRTADSFKGKTIELACDIKIGDLSSNNGYVFYPIGYYNTDGTYEKTQKGITSDFRNFEGTFDGNGHTISNFYQNTWEMKGDHSWYAPEDQYFCDGFGLFGIVYGGTVKNLTIHNFSADSEIGNTGCVAAYADCGATFENIAITNCNPRVYNIGNGGIVGNVGWFLNENTDKVVTFKNITVDNTNKISALWGSYDVPCGGLVGFYDIVSKYGFANPGIHMENCHVAAQLDVYNDVCANYQYYAYRYAGMLIGSISENETIDGHVYPKMAGITAKDCTVHFGDWNDYYYCELVANTTASYTHDHQMSRLEQVAEVYQDGETWKYVPLNGTKEDAVAILEGRVNYVVVKSKNDDGTWKHGDGENYATCYHFVDGAVWNHADAGTETVNGQPVLKEDKQLVYREFDQLCTGYGWGVTSKGIGDLAGVTILDREEANSVVKFEKADSAKESYTTETTIIIGDLFKANGNAAMIDTDNVQVFLSPIGEESTASAVYAANTEDWTQGTLTFSGIGAATITISDYYFCTPTTVNVTIKEREPEVKFEKLFDRDFLYRVGNQEPVSLGKLFKQADDAAYDIVGDDVEVTIGTVDNTGASGTYTPNATWTNGTIQFSGTGVVKVTITDNDYCIPTELTLEVVDAVNATSAPSGTITSNVVLLNDTSSSNGGFTVSGRSTVFGNGFTFTYTGNGQYLNNGLKQGVITVQENGTLDNLRIKAPIYPAAYMYYGKTSMGDYVQSGPSTVDGDKTRYHYQLSAVAASGNATISNCYIYGGRNNIYVGDGNVTIEDTVLENAPVANVQIQSNASYAVTFEDVTTIQYLTNATIGDTSKKMLGTGIIVGPETNDNPAIVLKGSLKQYNWVTSDDKSAVSNSTAETIIDTALKATEFNHTINGKTASNLGIVYLNDYDYDVTNHTGLPYNARVISMGIASGRVYTLQNASADQIYSDYENADRTTENSPYQPQFKYSADLGGQYIEKTDDGDEFCYREGDTIHVMFPSGDTKELDLVKLVNIQKYSGQDLNLAVTVKDDKGDAVTTTDGKIALSEAKDYTVTYSVTDDLLYDKDGNAVGQTKKYSWDVTLSVSLRDTAVPNARFAFDSSVQKIFRSGNSNIVQFIPFLSGLKIYDYNADGFEYLRFDGGNTSTTTDFNKIAKASIENKNTTGEAQGYHIVTIELIDGGKLIIDMDVRANSGSSTHSGSIKVRNNVIYVVNGGTTSGKGQTWKIYSYKFVGNNGAEIDSGLVTFGTSGTDCDTATKPSSNFSTTVKATVTYQANGGNCGQSTGYATSVAAAVTLPTPARSGYIFAGWFTAASGGTRVGGAGENYTPSANITLYAQWGKPCTVTYNANGGTCGTASEKYTGTALTLPTPTRDDYWFIGWYDAAEGGTKIGDAGSPYLPTGEITLYAHWQEKVEYTVTYNANDGFVTPTSATYQGTALTLPTPTKTGYKCIGWYTAASGGTKIGDAGGSYTPAANITLYAQWTINSYTVTVTTNNATVKVNGTTVNNNGTVSIQYGAQVTVEVTYSESDSRSTTITGTDGTTYSSPFTMPAQNVTINATSSSCVTPDTLITLADGSQVRVDSLTGNEELLVWNMETGKLDSAPILFVDSDPTADYEIVHLYFSDGTDVKVIYEHGFWDYNLNRYVYLDANASEYIGHYFAKQDGDKLTRVTLTDVVIEREVTEAWSPVTEGHLCYFVNGMLSMPGGVGGLFNIFEVDVRTMSYDYDALARDIQHYGLFTYEELNAIEPLPEEMFDAAGGAYLKISIGKGNLTMDELRTMIRRYSKFF